jgi:hypothetical protein
MIKKILYFLPVMLIASSLVHAQDTAQLKRMPYKLTVAVDKKTVYEEALKEAPFVLPDNTIQLYPGEIVFIEIEQENGVIKRLKAVKEIKDSAKTLRIKFTQQAEKKIHKMMMLEVYNPFAYELMYDALIYLMRQKRWTSTSIYPVPAKLSGFETWPDIITSIAIGKLRFQQ